MIDRSQKNFLILSVNNRNNSRYLSRLLSLFQLQTLILRLIRRSLSASLAWRWVIGVSNLFHCQSEQTNQCEVLPFFKHWRSLNRFLRWLNKQIEQSSQRNNSLIFIEEWHRNWLWLWHEKVSSSWTLHAGKSTWKRQTDFLVVSDGNVCLSLILRNVSSFDSIDCLSGECNSHWHKVRINSISFVNCLMSNLSIVKLLRQSSSIVQIFLMNSSRFFLIDQ